MTRSAKRGVLETLQEPLSTTGNGNVLAIPNSFHNHKVFIKGSVGISAGAVQLEAADSPDYAGTWAQIGGGPITLVASTELQLDFSGVYQFIRARYSTNVTGGTAGVTYVGS